MRVQAFKVYGCVRSVAAGVLKQLASDDRHECDHLSGPDESIPIAAWSPGWGSTRRADEPVSTRRSGRFRSKLEFDSKHFPLENPPLSITSTAASPASMAATITAVVDVYMRDEFSYGLHLICPSTSMRNFCKQKQVSRISDIRGWLCFYTLPKYIVSEVSQLSSRTHAEPAGHGRRAQKLNIFFLLRSRVYTCVHNVTACLVVSDRESRNPHRKEQRRDGR